MIMVETQTKLDKANRIVKNHNTQSKNNQPNKHQQTGGRLGRGHTKKELVVKLLTRL